MIRADLPELTSFIAIAEQRSFSAAARMLGVSPSALSHPMRNLEARLEMRLFNRTTRSVALTEAGEQLLNGVRPLIADLANVVNEVTSSRATPSGSILINASELSLRPLIRHVLPDFTRRYPQIHIEFVVDSTQMLAEWSPNYSGLCLYYPANRHPPMALRLFVQAVREWAGQEPRNDVV
ncbi:LysR family transcriptional regulator [Pseudomonas sp. W2-17]|uniref:LysR family transcriptional regulator n=1 Tax=Pseudomonas sp. W2-17 TaxID=3058039 RepID=UPI0034E0C137